MEAINLTDFLLGLGRVSAQAGVLVVLVLLAQLLFRRQLSPRWRSALWLLVMVRLSLPVSIGSVVSIFNLWPRLPASAPNEITLFTPPTPGHFSPAVQPIERTE